MDFARSTKAAKNKVEKEEFLEFLRSHPCAPTTFQGY